MPTPCVGPGTPAGSILSLGTIQFKGLAIIVGAFFIDADTVCRPRDAVATITRTPSETRKAVVRKQGWPTTIKTFRTRRDASDWARRTENEMVRGVSLTAAAPSGCCSARRWIAT